MNADELQELEKEMVEAVYKSAINLINTADEVNPKHLVAYVDGIERLLDLASDTEENVCIVLKGTNGKDLDEFKEHQRIMKEIEDANIIKVEDNVSEPLHKLVEALSNCIVDVIEDEEDEN